MKKKEHWEKKPIRKPKYLLNHPAIYSISLAEYMYGYRWNIHLKDGWSFKHHPPEMIGGLLINNKKDFDSAGPIVFSMKELKAERKYRKSADFKKRVAEAQNFMKGFREQVFTQSNR